MAVLYFWGELSSNYQRYCEDPRNTNLRISKNDILSAKPKKLTIRQEEEGIRDGLLCFLHILV